MRPCSNKFLSLGIVGLLALFFGSTLHILWPKIFQAFLSKELPIKENSRVFNLWKDTSEIPMTMNFYFFNWTNPEELKLPGKKPNLVQLGPYSFIHKTEKINIVFHPENNTVSYGIRKFWYFDPSKSNGTLEDRIFHLNVVAVTAANKVRHWSYFMQNTLSYMLNKLSENELHVVKTVDELLFKGYSDPIISMGKMAVSENVPPFDKFGWFYMRNGTTFLEGHFNIETGQDDIKEIGKMRYWNYKNKTNFFKAPCNEVEGSAGEFWPPGQETNEINIFSADLCRTVTYEYSGSTLHRGIAGNRYEMGDKTLANNTLGYFHEKIKYFDKSTTTEDYFNTDNSTNEMKNNNKGRNEGVNMGKCFCNGECTPMGLINVTSCRYGAPGFISLPHFYKADPILRTQVDGMNPNPRDHSFYIDLEPTTGIPLDVAARLQVNILLQPSKTIELLKNVPKIYLPIMWFDLRGGTTDNLAASLQRLLMFNKIGLYGSIIIACAGGIILVIVGILQYSENRQHGSQNIKKIDMSNVNGKTEKVYMDIMSGNDENERTDCQLYPKN